MVLIVPVSGHCLLFHFYHKLMPQINAGKIANSAEADQAASLHCSIKLLCPKTEGSCRIYFSYEPRREKTCFFHMRKQRRRSASQ